MSNVLIFIFKEDKYNLTKEYCANIEQHTNDSIYSEIENEVIYYSSLLYSSFGDPIIQVINFNNAKSLTENFVPILIAFYIGSWSDKYGRKPFIFLFLAGTFIDLIGTLLSGIFLDEISKYVWLAIALPSRSLAGGSRTFSLMVFNFVSDNSSPRYEYLNLQKTCNFLFLFVFSGIGT